MEIIPQNQSTTTKAITAEDINTEHDQAQSLARDAIKHAIRCGEMLKAKKKELPHGKFMPWVKGNCKFEYSTAARYMKAAEQSSTGVELLSLSEVFPSGRPDSKKPDSKVAAHPPIARPAPSEAVDFASAPITSAKLTKAAEAEIDKAFAPGSVTHTALFGDRIPPALPAPPATRLPASTVVTLLEALKQLAKFCRTHEAEKIADGKSSDKVKIDDLVYEISVWCDAFKDQAKKSKTATLDSIATEITGAVNAAISKQRRAAKRPEART